MDGIGYTPGSGSQVAVETVDGKMVQIVKLSAANGWYYAGPSGGVDSSGDIVLVAAPGGGKRAAITGLQFHNASAAATELILKDGLSTVLWRGYAPNAMGMMQNVPFCLKASENKDIRLMVVSPGIQLRVSAQGFTEAV